jgi:amino acid transporter
MATETATTTTTGLRRNAIGLREVTFQSITDMAPGAAIAASIPAGVAFAGGSLPLSVVFALIACLFCAVSIGLLARELPAAGSVATYAARGLHPSIGFLVAWGYVLVGFLIPPLVLLQLGFTTAATLNAEIHGYPADLWWPWALLGAVIVLAAGFYGIRTSARLGTVLGIFEIGVFLVLAIFFIFHAGSNNTLSVFTTKYTPAGQFHGLTGVIAGSVYTILAFGGFEGAARWPRRPRTRGGSSRARSCWPPCASARCTCSPPTPWTSRTGPRSSTTSPPAPGPRRGRAWPVRCTASSGSSCSWPSSTPPSPTRTPA